jgi:hypothetical protein
MGLDWIRRNTTSTAAEHRALDLLCYLRYQLALHTSQTAETGNCRFGFGVRQQPRSNSGTMTRVTTLEADVSFSIKAMPNAYAMTLAMRLMHPTIPSHMNFSLIDLSFFVFTQQRQLRYHHQRLRP